MKRLLIILFLFLCGQLIWSQYNCLFEHYSTEDGLSHGSVSDIIKDSRGFMWFSTFDGINKFDGYTFTTYKARPGDSTSLSSNRVIQLLEDRWGFIWLQTYNLAVYRFSPRTETFENILNNPDGSPLSVKLIYKSSLDDIWLATSYQGLYRVVTNPQDLTFKVFRYSDLSGESSSLNSNSVLSIFEDEKKQIWINTVKGLNCLQYNSLSGSYEVGKLPHSISEQFKQYHFTSFAEHSGKLWLGTQEGDLLCYDPAKQDCRALYLNNTHPITCMVRSKNGNLYVGTSGNGLYRYPINEKEPPAHFQHPMVNKVILLFIDSYGTVWIETDKDGVMKVNPDFSGFKHFTQYTDVDLTYLPRSAIGLREDVNHVLWISLKGGGFGFYNRPADQLEYFYNKPGDPSSKMSNYVNCFFKDSTNVLWICTYYKGIEKITFLENKFRVMKFETGSRSLIPNEVRALFEDAEGYLWVGTKNGTLYILDKENKIIRKFTKETGNGMVYSMLEDRDNNIWLGTKGKGLYLAKHTGQNRGDYIFSHYGNNPLDPNSLSSDLIYSVTRDSKDRIWIGTFGQGLNLVTHENGKINFINSNNSFRNYPGDKGKRIRYIREDSRGLLWIATTEGLLLVNPNQGNPDTYSFDHYYKIPGNKSSLGSNDIYYIFNDKTDTIWLGTLGGGLHKLISYPEKGSAPKFKIYTKADGLPSDVILSIEADINNNLWISTENGIACFIRKTGAIKCYDEYDGLHLASFSEATSLARSTGEIYIGAMDGLYSFFPEEFTDKTVHTNLVLTHFRLFNQDVIPGVKGSPLKESITATDEIKLTYKQSMFSIEYAGLDYSAQHKIQYAYMLEGFDPPDSGWHYVKNQRIATYTNIPPGEYRFRVRFVNPELKDSNSERQLSIVIMPPPWKTRWAYAAYIVLLLLLLEVARRIIFTMIRLRNKVTIEREISDMKLRFFTNISHELRTPLTLIIGPVEEITRTEKLSPKGREHIQMVEKNTRRLLKFINQLLDFRKIQNNKMILRLAKVDLIVFVKEIWDSFRDMASEKKINFLFNADVEQLDLWIDEEKMDIVIFNLLSNAFKFTPAGRCIEVKVSGLDHHEFVNLVFRDEGIGIPADKIPMIFKRFADIHDPKNVRNVGTGIGLSLSKELVDLHGGTIVFESTEGVGTTFTISLKLGENHFNKEKVEFLEDMKPREINPETDSYRISESTMIKNVGKGKITRDKPLLLIVEDNDDLRRFLRNQLSGSFVIEEAENGQAGLKKAIDILPEIIISDVMMPILDGIELLNKLKTDFNTSHIPVILLSAKSSIESRIEGLKYGADAYITKPFNSQYLLASALNLLEQRKLLFQKFTNHVKVLDFAEKEIIVTDRDHEFIKKIMGFIEDNISNPDFKIETIAKTIGLGRTSFFKKIKGLTGKSPIDFVNELRLQKAEKLLEKGEYNVSEISYMCGFSDPGYFSKRFRKKYKMSPSAYRDKGAPQNSP